MDPGQNIHHIAASEVTDRPTDRPTARRRNSHLLDHIHEGTQLCAIVLSILLVRLNDRVAVCSRDSVCTCVELTFPWFSLSFLRISSSVV